MITRLIFVKLRNPTNFVHIQRRNVTDIMVPLSPLVHMMGSFGGTKIVEQGLLFCHDTLHSPWWLGILGVTITIKALLFPLTIVTLQSESKLFYVESIMEPKLIELEREIRTRGKEKQLNSNVINALVRRSVRDAKREAYIKNNCHPARKYPLMAAQIPVWLSVTFALRNFAVSSRDGGAHFYLEQHRFISDLPLDFADCGFLWISSLSAPDPYFMLPALLFASSLCSYQLKRSDILMADDKIKFQQPKGMTVLHVFNVSFTIFITCICAFVPSGIGLYWLFSSTLGFFLSLMLKYPKPRQFLRILPSPLESKNPQPFKNFIVSFGRIFGKKK